jgi:hypothetical protein
MHQQENRKLRQDLSPQERERAERIGNLNYTSHRIPDMRIEEYPGIGPKGRAA